MAQGRIAIDPALLMSQSAEMTSLTEEFDALFASVSNRLTAMNGQWSANLANNFGTKIQSAGSAFTTLSALLRSGAESARNSASTFQSLDNSLQQTLESNSLINRLFRTAIIGTAGLPGLAGVIGWDYAKKKRESEERKRKQKEKEDRERAERERQAAEEAKRQREAMQQAAEEAQEKYRHDHSVIVNDNPDYQHQWDAEHFYITPPKENHEGYRYPDAYMEVMQSLDVEHNYRYQEAYNPFWGFSATCCNIYVWDVLTAMDCKLPSVDYFGCGAMRDWMASPAGQDAGWVAIDKETAIAMANQGYPTVAADTAGGHVAMVAPQQEGDSGLYLSQAGANNFSYGTFNNGWGSGYNQDTDICYFYHK